MSGPLDGRTILITGIANENSLALAIARSLKQKGASLVCAGLGLTRHSPTVSESAKSFLQASQQTFEECVSKHLGPEVPTVIFDGALDGSLEDAASELSEAQRKLDGVLHAIAFDRTIRGGDTKKLLDVSRSEFLDCMSVSAYTLIGLTCALYEKGLLERRASIVALSYLGAERITQHPYRNIGVAKAALERIAIELAYELGHAEEIRVNAVRFSPYAESRAGGAIPALVEAVEDASQRAPLGNATPSALAEEIAYLMGPDSMVTGEIRHVDGGFHRLA